MSKDRKIEGAARKTAVFKWMLLRLMSGEPVSDRKRYAFLMWLADDTNEDFKFDTMDRVFTTLYGRV